MHEYFPIARASAIMKEDKKIEEKGEERREYGMKYSGHEKEVTNGKL